MIRPVERFAVNIGGQQDPGEVERFRPLPPRTGIGPVGLAAAMCLGAALTLLAQQLLADGRVARLVGGLLRGLIG